MFKLRAIIIENEIAVLENLKRKINRFCPEVEVIDDCITGREGIAAIQRYRPDVVFLDIQLSRMTAFDMLEQLDVIDFEIIFTTAHQKFAVQAINMVSPLGYLIKPVDVDELKEAVEKLIRKQQGLAQQNGELEIEAVSEISRSERVILPFRAIQYLKSEGKHTLFYCQGDTQPLEAIRGISYYEAQLPEPCFCRIHRSYLINLKFLSAYDPKTSGSSVFLRGYSRSLPVSDTYYAIFQRQYRACSDL